MTGRDAWPRRPRLAFEVSSVQGQTHPGPRAAAWRSSWPAAPAPPPAHPPRTCPSPGGRSPQQPRATTQQDMHPKHVFRPLREGPAGHTARSGPGASARPALPRAVLCPARALQGRDRGGVSCSRPKPAGLADSGSGAGVWPVTFPSPAPAPARQSGAFPAGRGQGRDSPRSHPDRGWPRESAAPRRAVCRRPRSRSARLCQTCAP